MTLPSPRHLLPVEELTVEESLVFIGEWTDTRWERDRIYFDRGVAHFYLRPPDDFCCDAKGNFQSVMVKAPFDRLPLKADVAFAVMKSVPCRRKFSSSLFDLLLETSYIQRQTEALYDAVNRWFREPCLQNDLQVRKTW